MVAVKSGFSSGYGGEGPRTFSEVLAILKALRVEIEEVEVEREVLARLDNSALTEEDLQRIQKTQPIRPLRWYDYILHEERQQVELIWKEFPPSIPLSIVDGRIIDLAISFWDAPDERLLTGYRRLEEEVRKRTGLQEHGAKMFSQAFLGTGAKLLWKDIPAAEQEGRANLFSSAFKAFRNPRAHRTPETDPEELLAEFLMLNQLFRLERVATNA